MKLYALGAAALIFAGLIAATLWYRAQATHAVAQRDMARAELRLAVDANRASQETIARLRAEAAANDRIMSALAAEIASIDKRLSETNEALDGLKDSDVTVRDYLSQPIPPELVRLLND